MITYFDTSTLVKLVVDEAGSQNAELIWLGSETPLSSSLVVVESRAAVAAMRRAGKVRPREFRLIRSRLSDFLSDLQLIDVDLELVDHAAEIAETNKLRGYDAVHLAAALNVGVEVFTSADRELCAAAARNGLDVVNPLDAQF